MIIRRETADDIVSIHAVVMEAFGRPAEADLVDRLRDANALTLSAVGIVAGRVVGHIAFSPVTIGACHPALALAPVAVASDFRRQGIASALIQWSLEECRRAEHQIVIVLGSPGFYPRFGFTAAKPFGVECPFPVDEETFMLAELHPGASTRYCGVVRYHREFDAL